MEAIDIIGIKQKSIEKLCNFIYKISLIAFIEIKCMSDLKELITQLIGNKKLFFFV